MEIVRVENVSFGYGKEALVKNASFSVSQHDFCCIVGPNGSGKTTLLKLLLGLLTPWEGKISIFDQPPAKSRNLVGYMPQNLQYDPKFPICVFDVILQGRIGAAGFRYRGKDYEAAEKALVNMQLEPLRDHTFSELSGGQRQRVLIARALACEPKLMVFDEPTTSIDALIESKLIEILKQLNQQMAIIMVSHNIRFVADVVNKVICVDKQVAVHPTGHITDEFVDELHRGHFRMIRHDHCEEPV